MNKSYKTRIAKLEVINNQVAVSFTGFKVPEMTIADYFIMFDSLRIPEALEQIERCINVRPEARNSMESYIAERLADKEKLERFLVSIRELYEAGQFSLDEYLQLTTAQNYSHKHLQALQKQVSYFIPQWEGNGNKGDVYVMTGELGLPIYLRFENDHWIQDPDPYGLR